MRLLLTGFPGFIGTRLAAELLGRHDDLELVALVEGRMLEAARSAAGRLQADGRIEVVAGDITDRRLGLGEQGYAELADGLTHVAHLAAIYDLSVPVEAAQRVNVEGTGNVLELCERIPNLERLVYASTAYVAGLRTGIVYEHELSLGQTHKNHYESTKFQAELWVQDALRRGLPTTIVRPAIVVGDSRTGETSKFDGPYYILRSVSRAVATNTPIVRFGRSRALFNVVPVDYVTAALATVTSDPRAANRTLHLVDPEPLTSGELFGLLAREYAGREPRGRVPAKLVQAALHAAPVRELFGGAPPESITYLDHPVAFDTRETETVLAPHGLRPPNFADYVGPIVRFFREHEDDPAFAPGGFARG